MGDLFVILGRCLLHQIPGRDLEMAFQHKQEYLKVTLPDRLDLHQQLVTPPDRIPTLTDQTLVDRINLDVVMYQMYLISLDVTCRTSLDLTGRSNLDILAAQARPGNPTFQVRVLTFILSRRLVRGILTQMFMRHRTELSLIQQRSLEHGCMIFLKPLGSFVRPVIRKVTQEISDLAIMVATALVNIVTSLLLM